MEGAGARSALRDAKLAEGPSNGHVAGNRGGSGSTDGAHASRVGGRDSDDKRSRGGRKPRRRAASALSKQVRQLRTTGEQTVRLERSYGYCPTCQVGFFPAFLSNWDCGPRWASPAIRGRRDGALGDMDAVPGSAARIGVFSGGRGGGSQRAADHRAGRSGPGAGASPRSGSVVGG